METQSFEGFRLSPQQERLWRAMEGQKGQEAPAWQARVEVEITGALDVEALRRALAAAVARHEILRTEFRVLPGMTVPLQVVTDRPVPQLEVRKEEALHRLVLTLPVLLADAKGLENLVREVSLAYGGETPDEEPAQYIDLSEWQHELLVAERTQAGRDYWRNQPDGTEAPAGSFEPRTVPVPLAPGLEANRETLLAVWGTLLARVHGEPEVLVGVAFDGRKLDGLAVALGPFARLLPVRVQVGGNRLADLAGALRETLAEHAEWQEYFAGDAPAVGFELRRAPAAVRAGGALFTLRERRARLGRTTLDLLVEEGDVLRAEIGYDAARVSDAEALRLAERYAALLTAAVAEPDCPALELDLLGAGERRLLAAWNQTGVDFGVVPVLHRLVEAQAARTPERTALEWDGGRLTYAELEGRANRLAHRLRIEPEDRVAVCCERSPEMVVGLLAAWKAGGAWVPLDPSHPAERRAAVLEDARPRVLLTQGDLALDLSDPSDHPPDRSDRSDPSDASRLAYVIYTSGSTGRPKGVMVSHGAIANRLLWMRRAFPLAEDDAVLQKTPFVFDAAIWELFLPLLCGGRLVLAGPGAHQDPAALAGALRRHGATVLQLIPSLLGPFLDEDLAGCGLRRLFCGGEALPAPLVERAFQRLPGVELCNLYGPTECAIDVTFHPCRPGRPEGGILAIGRPIDNLRVWLLDARCQGVPPGLPGELCAAGAGLARGYLGRPDLTAERFLPDPCSGVPGGRLYRTGDLARQGPDGTLEFLGRIDRQVKIRGFRIEPGEIESALAAHPSVAEAAVAVREDVPGDRRLAAYVVPRAGQEPAAAALRAFLAERLPEPMVPASFTRLAALPRLASGKLDRGALPAPAAAEGFAAPRTPTEELLAVLWAEVLGVERLGRHDNVYALGWHSLLATRFVSRLRRTFGVDLALRSLFENPTVAALAARIDEALRGGAAPAPRIVPVPREDVRPELPLSYAQRRLWFLDRLQPGSPFYNIPMALRFSGPLDTRALARGLAEIVRRHEALRTRFAEVAYEPVQAIDPPAPVPLPLVDLGGLTGELRAEELRRRIAEEALAPFDLAAGPLLRALLVRLGPEEHAGLLTVHHIVSDGWSTAILVRELTALYGAFSRRSSSPLPEPPIQYADFAVWQRGWLQGETLAAQIEHWRERLAGAPPLLELPADRPRPEEQSFRGATRGRPIPAEVAGAVRALSREGAEGATLFMVLLAAGAALLGWHACQEDVVVGTDVSGRDRGETEGVIGFFINQLALRLRLDGDPTFRELLGRARETALAAYAHQDLPFDLLVEALNPARSRHAPVFQAKINLHQEPPPALALPGLSIEPLPVARATAQFDCILNLAETGDSFLAAVEYSTDLFDAATIDRMLGNFEALLAAIGERPEARLSELCAVLAASDERQRQAAAAERRQEKRLGLQRARRQAVGAPEPVEVSR